MQGATHPSRVAQPRRVKEQVKMVARPRNQIFLKLIKYLGRRRAACLLFEALPHSTHRYPEIPKRYR
jgi:hypothetical protein